MKFFGTPNLLVKDSKNDDKPLFRFNDNGEFETEDERLIKRLKQHFKFEDNVKSDSIQCKKCERTFDTKGDLLAHYRKDHPKEGD